MAGTQHLYNTDPLELAIAAVELANGVAFQREYLDITLQVIDGLCSQLTFTPKIINSYSLYVDATVQSFNKLDMTTQLPKDMCYSGAYPMSLASLTNFLLASYDLLIGPGEWELVQNAMVHPVDASLNVRESFVNNRQLILRTTASHPLFVEGMSLPLLITSPDFVLNYYPITVVGAAPDGIVGTPTTYTYVVDGGVAPFSYRVIGAAEGITVPDATVPTISLSPITSGPHAWTLRIIDSVGTVFDYVDSANFAPLYAQLVIIGAFDVAFISLPYSSDLLITGGDAHYSNPRTTVGTLPGWAMLTIVDGMLRCSGTPTYGDQTFSVTVAVDSGDGQTALLDVTVHVTNITRRTTQNIRRATTLGTLRSIRTL